MDTTNFSAMPHQMLTNHFRVPVCKHGDDYVVYLGYKYTRIFKDKLPDYIQGKVTLATARNNNLIDDKAVTWHDLYTYKGDMDSMENIGWQVSDSVYIVVLSKDEVDILKGDSVNSQIDS